MMEPYYEQDGISIFCGDCRETFGLMRYDVLVTDPPYPNNGGRFVDAIPIAREILATNTKEAMIFWSEVEIPPLQLPLVALHICTYNNVNGRLFEAIYHFSPDGQKRRSEVMPYWMIKPGIGPAEAEYVGHPSQKPTAVMCWLVRMTHGIILDPFMGSGTTLVAAKQLGRKAIGIEISEEYCEIAVKRLRQTVMTFEPPVPAPQQTGMW